MLHGKKEIFIEDFEGYKVNKYKEEEANRFAMKCLLPSKAIEELPFDIVDADIFKLAKKYQTHPGIVVGRLQWNDQLNIIREIT